MKYSVLLSLLCLTFPLSTSHAQGSNESRAIKTQTEYTEKLQSQIVADIKKTDPEKIPGLVSNPEFLQKLLRWKFQDTIPAQTLADFSARRDPLLLSSFLHDKEWLMGFLNSGPIPNPDQALKNLSFLYKKDKKMADNATYKKIATSAALEFARNINPAKPDEKSEWNNMETLEKRYGYFRTSYDKQLLNPQFSKLDYWDMRILTGSKLGGWGSVESLTWQRDNVRLPAQSYTGACWQAPYRLNNEWGESIHGRDYFVPFRELFSSDAEMVKKIGAVCGGLSHYGAHAAIANGIPALTMGEPGHCAYTVRTTIDHWAPAYSLSWKRGCHWSFYGHQWSFLILMQDNFSDKEKLGTSTNFLWMAQAADKSGDASLARSLYLKSLMAQPKNYEHWQAYLDWEIKQKTLTAAQWSVINDQLCNAYAKDFPEVCWILLSQKVYPNLLPLLSSDKAKREAIEKFHLKLETMTPAQWDYTAALDKQRDLIGSSLADLKEFTAFLVKTHLNSDSYGAPTLSWCNDKMSIDKNLHKDFLAMVAQSNESGGESTDKAITALAENILLQAEKSGDLDSFQKAGALIKDKFKPILPKFDPFPGELLSSGGLLQLSSVSGRWGAPWQHWGVLEECGGGFHTDNKLEAESATVVMKRVGTLSGLVVIHDSGHLSRSNNTIIEASTDGTTWKEIGKIDKMQRINRIDLKDKKIQAKYVRLTRPGKEFYHLQAILVYGTRAS